MLARSLLAGLRRCAASSVAAAGAAVPAAPAGGAVPVAHSAGTALRSLASLCMHSSGGVGGSLASSSLASSTSGGGALSSSSSQALAAARGLLSRWGGVQQLQQLRGRTTSAHLTRKLRFKGGKMKTYSSMKSRFRLTGGAEPKVMYSRPGHVHKRFNKSKRQLFALSGTQALTPKYAKVVKKLGFCARRW
ncbi:50S ribosomal L35 [Micractinium conductrix]|uniref:50S ribosomal L35 n=1 Tax=Micractinium conductrix TaxID=554055 RepID=A0A2P6V936_9CHLO|nr:50S ribosomal L35 [Micractinium conductrix]|eukprot:PSC70598.1 50S ribosomal L35 [Micractinium conductrix]